MYSKRNITGELITLTAIGLTLLSALITFGVKAIQKVYTEHEAQKKVEMEHRDIAIHNRIMYSASIKGNRSNLQDVELQPRERYEIPNFIEDEIEYGTDLRIEYIVHVGTTILNDDGIYERIDKDVYGVCKASFRESILFTISQRPTSSPKEFSFICGASEYS